MTDPISSQVAQERALDLAERAIPLIDQLLESKGWAYFRDRLSEERQRAAHSLEADIPLEETIKLRARIRQIDDTLDLPARDRAHHYQTIRHLKARPEPRRG